ncbi:MAG TPA: glutamine--fructose-6-phosphate aminotransferase, partial [Ramlibacter sp.]|nr:glutamine--fructose-6-phosphate aminotransferase [Ramlibacter sp.]
MCGIVGAISGRNVVPILIEGLKRLEYRGYDSAGVAVVNGTLQRVRCSGRVAELEKLAVARGLEGSVGIAHTRWATHGIPSERNAHPHVSGGVSVVHNGIIENHLALKAQLKARGHAFSSETDSEVFAHLVADAVEAGQSLPDAVRAAVAQVKGTYALVVVAEQDPSCIVATREAQPMVLGLSQGQNFVASDVPALLEHTRDFVYLGEGDLAVLTAAKVEIFDRAGLQVERPHRRIDWTPM